MVWLIEFSLCPETVHGGSPAGRSCFRPPHVHVDRPEHALQFLERGEENLAVRKIAAVPEQVKKTSLLVEVVADTDQLADQFFAFSTQPLRTNG